jgi:peptide/nickel transport system substrate-binding protein/oligopeptide transport system substrate-binding protein
MMTDASEPSHTEDPSPRRDLSSRKRAFLIPGALLVLFLLTALATRLVKEEALRADLARSADVQGRPVQGGVFRYPLLHPIHTLDPAQAVYQTDVMLVQQLYDGLTAFDKHLNVAPALAKFWEISPDGRSYTFELRSDARFHNGRKVVAEDCVFSFERLLTKGLNEHNYHYFSRIEGAEAFHEGRARRVSGLEAIGESTFRIRFVTPFVPALSVLSMYSSKILPKKEVLDAGERFFEAPIGTGAFQFSRWIEPSEDAGVPLVKGVRQGIRLEANPQYFEGRPNLDAVTFRAFWNSKDHEGDPRPLHEVADCLDTNEVERYSDWVAVEADRLLALRYLYFPNHVPAYDDARVRRALNLALDRRSFLDSHGITAGIPAATGVVPPGIPGFIPKETKPDQNIETARELLAAAGYPGGKGLPPLLLPVLREGMYPREAASHARDGCLIACLSKVGVEVRRVEVDRVVSVDDPAFRGRAVLFDRTWYADFPDPDNFLRPLFHSRGYMNTFGYSSAEVDRLLDQVWSETSYSARNKLYHYIEELILEDAPIIPTDYGRLRYLLRPNVRGFSLTPLGAPYIKFKDVWLAEEGRSAEVPL